MINPSFEQPARHLHPEAMQLAKVKYAWRSSSRRVRPTIPPSRARLDGWLYSGVDTNMQDYDDPEVETQWLAERREEILQYLRDEGVPCGRVGDVAAWHVSPYVSVWAVEALAETGSIGWWAICGDLPNDYVSAVKAKSPREAVRAIASVWRQAAQYMSRGERHPTFVIGTGDRDEELAPMLASRADLLLDWVDDDDVWDDDVH